ncbi:MAG: glycosyltransferase [bacterium]
MRDGKLHIFQFAHNAVCARPRLEIPAKHLTPSGQFEFTTFRRLDTNTCTRIITSADMLILQYLPYSPGLGKLMHLLNQTGRPVIFEIDDDLLDLEPDSPYLEVAPKGYPERLRQTLLRAQAVQCSTRALAESLAAYHREVAVLENQLDEMPVFRAPAIQDRAIVVGYAAGENHGTDWVVAREAFNRCLAEAAAAGREVQVCIIGDRAIYDSIESRHKHFLPVLGYSDYLQVLGCFDISLMPLANTRFNRAKSDLKFLESAACSCAVIGSDIAYSRCIKHGESGLLFHTPTEFAECLRSLLREPEQIPRLARAAYTYVKENRLMGQHIHKWQATYLNWYRRRKELIAASIKKRTQTCADKR